MKKYVLFAGLLSLLWSNSAFCDQAAFCTQTPDCSSLGYNAKASYCSDPAKIIRCPFDPSMVFCNTFHFDPCTTGKSYVDYAELCSSDLEDGVGVVVQTDTTGKCVVVNNDITILGAQYTAVEAHQRGMSRCSSRLAHPDMLTTLYQAGLLDTSAYPNLDYLVSYYVVTSTTTDPDTGETTTTQTNHVVYFNVRDGSIEFMGPPYNNIPLSRGKTVGAMCYTLNVPCGSTVANNTYTNKFTNSSCVPGSYVLAANDAAALRNRHACESRLPNNDWYERFPMLIVSRRGVGGYNYISINAAGLNAISTVTSMDDAISACTSKGENFQLATKAELNVFFRKMYDRYYNITNLNNLIAQTGPHWIAEDGCYNLGNIATILSNQGDSDYDIDERVFRDPQASVCSYAEGTTYGFVCTATKSVTEITTPAARGWYDEQW